MELYAPDLQAITYFRRNRPISAQRTTGEWEGRTEAEKIK